MSERGRAKMLITETGLREFLGLSENTEIRAVEVTQDPIQVLVHVTGPQFPVTHPMMESIYFHSLGDRRDG